MYVPIYQTSKGQAAISAYFDVASLGFSLSYWSRRNCCVVPGNDFANDITIDADITHEDLVSFIRGDNERVPNRK
jgi:hypothetical protein